MGKPQCGIFKESASCLDDFFFRLSKLQRIHFRMQPGEDTGISELIHVAGNQERQNGQGDQEIADWNFRSDL